MKSPKPKPKSKPQDQTLTPEEKLEAATADAEKWSMVANKPGMSPQASAWAAQAARSAQAEMRLRQKAAGQQAENPDQPPDDPNLTALLGTSPSPPDQSPS